MALHPNFPVSHYAPLIPAQRWFSADEALCITACEKRLSPLVAKVRPEVFARLMQWCAAADAEDNGQQYDLVFVEVVANLPGLS